MSWKIFLICSMVMAYQISSYAAVIANVGEKKITTDDIKKEFEHANSDQKKAINSDKFTRQNIVDSFVNTEVLIQSAVSQGIDKESDYQVALEKFRRQYLATKMMQKSIDPKLSSNELKKFYNENKNLFDTTEVCAEHIVVADEKTAEKLTVEAKSSGNDFGALALKNSIDPTVQENKGNLGCFSREKMVTEFADVAFKMHKKEIRGPVRTVYGYHVIKVTDIKPGKVQGFDEVEQRVKEIYRIKLVKGLITELREKAKVKINDDEVTKMKL